MRSIGGSMRLGSVRRPVLEDPLARTYPDPAHSRSERKRTDATLLGAMIAFDMGGPVNKTAFFFGAAMIREGDFRIMGACAAAICTPPFHCSDEGSFES